MIQQQSEKHRKRSAGIDLLRCVSMMMIIILHILAQGGVMTRYANHLDTYSAVWLLETFCFGAVNIYALISGYIGIRSQTRPSRLAELWLGVLFYSLGITAVFAAVRPEYITGEVLLQSFLPVSWRTYWYFSSYAAVFVLAPYMKIMVHAMSERQRRSLMRTMFVLFCLLPAVPKMFDVDVFRLVGGYSLIWLLILYVFGACLRETEFRRLRRWQYLLIYVLCCLVSWIVKMKIDEYTRASIGKIGYGNILVNYTAPTIMIGAVCLLLAFDGLQIRSAYAVRLITYFGRASFFVYIMHTQPVIWNHVLKGAFKKWARMAPLPMLVRVTAAAAALFLILGLADSIRAAVFRVLRIRSFCDRLFDRIFARDIDTGKPHC